MTTSVRFFAWDLYSRDQVARSSPFQYDITAPTGQAITLVTPTGVDAGIPVPVVPKISFPDLGLLKP